MPNTVYTQGTVIYILVHRMLEAWWSKPLDRLGKGKTVWHFDSVAVRT